MTAWRAGGRREAIATRQLPLHLINGVEASTLWENHEIHIVGLGIDPAHPAIVDFLAGQTECRLARARLMAERLEKAQIPGALEGALALAEGGAITRGHFARWLIAQGKADNMANVLSTIWRAAKPAMRRHNGVQLNKPLMLFIIPAVMPCWRIPGVTGCPPNG